MTDRELLELAAKAAGLLDWQWSDFAGMDIRVGYQGGIYSDETGYWNPLESNEDALWLAVTLRFTVDIGIATVYVYSVDIDRSETTETKEYFHEPEEAYAATRRAIVRAAAEIGKGMKDDK